VFLSKGENPKFWIFSFSFFKKNFVKEFSLYLQQIYTFSNQINKE